MLKRLLFLFSIVGLFTTSLNAQVIDPIKWGYSIQKVSGDIYNLKFKAKIDVTWHLYSQNLPEGGPVPTNFKFASNPGYELMGKVTELSKPESVFDKSFGIKVSFFSHEAIFVQKIKVKNSQPFSIKGAVEYMCCNDQKCLPPKSVDFEFNIPETSLARSSSTKETRQSQLETSTVAMSDTITKKDSAKAGISVAKTQPARASVDVSERTKEPESPWGFLFYAFIWGLAGVLTPCVYPMIPMTVSFFMRGEEKRSRGIVRGLVFGLSIVVIYTLIGVLVSLSILNPNIGNMLSTHWISNLVFFLLFLVFAASFLGMFEIILPSSLVNRIDKQAEKGGFMGAFFMALTLVIVSFSCTGPIVGKILIESAKGLSIKPIAGMLGYSLAFALPFTFFALFPSMLKSLPKSGGWLNSVKVVLGFIVLAFSLSFVANIDQNYGFNLLSRDIFLSIWIALTILLGMYLLGKIKFAHDSDVPYIAVPRFFLVVAVFTFAVYLFTGLLGHSLKSLSWILPPQEKTVSVVSQDNTVIANGLCSTPKYSDFLYMSNNLTGYFDYQEGLACAKEKNKPVFLDFKGHSCKNCKIMEAEVLSDPKVLDRLRNDFVIIALYTDDKFELPQNEWVTKSDGRILKRMDEKNQDLEISKFNSNALPLYAILDVQGNILGNPIEFTKDTEAFLTFLQKGKEAFYAK
jgi:thiol:disulfide interchange protein DsbD